MGDAKEPDKSSDRTTVVFSSDQQKVLAAKEFDEAKWKILNKQNPLSSLQKAKKSVDQIIHTPGNLQQLMMKKQRLITVKRNGIPGIANQYSR